MEYKYNNIETDALLAIKVHVQNHNWDNNSIFELFCCNEYVSDVDKAQRVIEKYGVFDAIDKVLEYSDDKTTGEEWMEDLVRFHFLESGSVNFWIGLACSLFTIVGIDITNSIRDAVDFSEMEYAPDEVNAAILAEIDKMIEETVS